MQNADRWGISVILVVAAIGIALEMYFAWKKAKWKEPKQVVHVHHVSHFNIDVLESIFAKPVKDKNGNLDWEIPEWLHLMRRTAK